MNRSKLLEIATKAAVEAGEAILKIYDKDFSVVLKEDHSPLTEADMASNSIINKYLEEMDIPIISEENRQIDYTVRKHWDNCWIVDPLDGTKEFVKRNGEFTVNISLNSKGKPILGIIYVPVSRELYYGDTILGRSYKLTLDSDHSIKDELFDEKNRIYPQKPDESLLKVVGSRSHMNDDTKNFIEEAEHQYGEIEIVSKGSSLKFCLVAEGKAHIYPRFAPTMEWDTAAGQAICEAVGLEVISRDTQGPLLYNKENLLNPYFVVQHA